MNWPEFILPRFKKLLCLKIVVDESKVNIRFYEFRKSGQKIQHINQSYRRNHKVNIPSLISIHGRHLIRRNFENEKELKRFLNSIKTEQFFIQTFHSELSVELALIRKDIISDLCKHAGISENLLIGIDLEFLHLGLFQGVGKVSLPRHELTVEYGEDELHLFRSYAQDFLSGNKEFKIHEDQFAQNLNDLLFRKATIQLFTHAFPILLILSLINFGFLRFSEINYSKGKLLFEKYESLSKMKNEYLFEKQKTHTQMDSLFNKSNVPVSVLADIIAAHKPAGIVLIELNVFPVFKLSHGQRFFRQNELRIIASTKEVSLVPLWLKSLEQDSLIIDSELLQIQNQVLNGESVFELKIKSI